MGKDWDSFRTKPPTQSQIINWMSPGMKVETQGDGAFERLNEILNPQGAYEKEKGFKKLPRQSSRGIIDFFVPIWKECLRVLRPGGLAFVMAPARSDCLWRQCAALEMAEFDVSLQPILWTYNSGFPKALDISKAFDKAAFREWLDSIDHGLTDAEVRKATSAAVNGGYSDPRPIGANNTYNSGKGAWHNAVTEGAAILSAIITRFWEPLSNLQKTEAWLEYAEKPDLSLPPGVRGNAQKYIHPRQVERGTFRDEWPGSDERITKKEEWLYGVDNRTLTAHLTETTPSTDLAKQRAGWKSHQLKPAFEFIIVARKPMSEKPIYENIKRWGVGGYNIDATRIPFRKEERPKGGYGGMDIGFGKPGETQDYSGSRECDMRGRFPANLVSSDGIMGKADKYFSLDRWAAENGFDEDWVAQAKAGLLRVTKPSKSEKTCNGEVENKHSTVKPVALFGWLLALGCPKGGLMLDPFVGSGSSCVAAVRGGWQYVGIEIDEHYVDIARARCSHAVKCAEKV